jgi:flagellar hook-basal body complex protein FliE
MSPIGSVNISSFIGSPEAAPAAKGMSAADASSLLNGAFGASKTSSSSSTGGASFSKLLSNAVDDVNAKMQTASAEQAKVLTGDTNNVHQSVIAMQESNVAFSMMVQVRNKLVESYQELMRMQV